MDASGIIHHVDIWQYSLNADTDDLKNLRAFLSEVELQRASRFVLPGLGDRFIAARGGLRRILAGYVGCEPAAIAFEVSDTGKPRLGRPHAGSEPVHFNLTHSGDVAAVAVCRTAPVGIDIEKVRPVNEGLAQRFFSPEETARIEAQPGPHAQLEAFFHCWTRKEAFVKATGEGISRGLDSFIVSVGAGEAARIFAIDGSANAAAAFCLHGFNPGEGFAGAVCVATGAAGNAAKFTLHALAQGPLNTSPIS